MQVLALLRRLYDRGVIIAIFILPERRANLTLQPLMLPQQEVWRVHFLTESGLIQNTGVDVLDLVVLLL